MPLKRVVTIKATSNSLSHACSEIKVRDLDILIDGPLERGGSNTGATPTEMAIAALIGCTNVIAHKCATKSSIDIGRLSIDASCEFDRAGVTLEQDISIPFKKIVQTIQSQGTATPYECQQVATQVAKFCPLSKLFAQAGTEMEVIWL